MSIKIHHGQSDEVIEAIIVALKEYAAVHPDAQIELYRQNHVSVRIRIIDPSFAPLERSERHKLVWGYLESVPEEPLADISTLLLLTPDETVRSFANLEFEEPAPSML